MSQQPKKSLFLAYFSLGVVCILWGTTFFGIRVGVQYLPPFLFAALRQLLGAFILLTATWIFTKSESPTRNYLGCQAIAGFLMITIANGLVSWAEVHVSSGLAAIICSLIPLYVVITNLFLNPEEKPNILMIAGMLICAFGVVLIFSEYLADFSMPEYILGIVLLGTANLGWVFGSLYIKKRISGGNPFLNSGYQMLFGGIWLIILSLLFDSYDKISWTYQSVGALAYLVIFGSVAAYSAYSYALKKLPLTIVSLYAYINPIIAVLLGWWFLGEKLSPRTALASLITVAGVYIVNWGYNSRKILKTEWSK